MLNTVYANAPQFQDLINAIQGGDTSAIATALGQIKTSVDGITTALGSLSTDVTQDSTQWTNLINAISSGGGGTIDIDATQWSNLLTEIAKGDTTAVVTALGNINGALGNIYTALGSLSINPTQWGNLITALSTQRLIMQDSTQWANLVNAISNQSFTVDLSNITSDVVTNESTVTPADTVTEALDALKSDLTMVSESTITPVSTYSSLFWYNKIYKKAGVVYVDIEFSDPSNTSPVITSYNTQIKIGTVPSGYRPLHRLYITFIIMNQINGSYMGVGQSMIDTSGDMYINIPRQCNFSCIQIAYIANG